MPGSAVLAWRVGCAWSGFAVRQFCEEIRVQSFCLGRPYCSTRLRIAHAVIFPEFPSSSYFLFGALILLHRASLSELVSY